jgi:hypothetical protein
LLASRFYRGNVQRKKDPDWINRGLDKVMTKGS